MDEGEGGGEGAREIGNEQRKKEKEKERKQECQRMRTGQELLSAMAEGSAVVAATTAKAEVVVAVDKVAGTVDGGERP